MTPWVVVPLLVLGAAVTTAAGVAMAQRSKRRLDAADALLNDKY